MRNLRAKLEFLLRMLLSNFQSHGFQRCDKQTGGYISPGHHVAGTELQICARFSSSFVAISVVCVKRKGNYISGWKLLFLHWVCL